jgi:starch phosphorylase
VALRRLDVPVAQINFGDSVRLEIAVALNGLNANDVVVEMLLGLSSKRDKLQSSRRYQFESTGTMTEAGEHIFAVHIQPEKCGKLEYRVRAYPYNDMLTHPFEMGMMQWL